MGNSIRDIFGILGVVYDFDHYFVRQTDQRFPGMADWLLFDAEPIGTVGICHISHTILDRQNIFASLGWQFNGGIF